jgi:hypothetical protein
VGGANLSYGSTNDGDPFTRQPLSFSSAGQPNNSQPPNQPPVINPIADQTVNELQTLAFKITATDADAGQTLAFNLVNPPAGASITASGDFSWTPTENQGPGNYTINVNVTDNGQPARSTNGTFQVTVREVNTAPTLDPISSLNAQAGQNITVNPHATDADLPAQTLTFSSVNALPAGATLNAQSGAFSWNIPGNQPAGTNIIIIKVTDDSQPALSAQQSFNIVISSAAAPPTLTATVVAQGQIRLSWPSEVGRRYRTQACDDIGAPTWQVINDVTGDGTVQSYIDSIGQGGKTMRFYRLLLD